MVQQVVLHFLYCLLNDAVHDILDSSSNPVSPSGIVGSEAEMPINGGVLMICALLTYRAFTLVLGTVPAEHVLGTHHFL